MKPMPREPVPSLSLDTVAHGPWRLVEKQPPRRTLIVVYRGLHCPICRTYLAELNRLAGEFDQRGVEIIAISADDASRAERTAQEWKLDAIRLGFGFSIDSAREWGLYLSTGRGTTSAGVAEPPLFAEPGIFLINDDRTLYFASVQTMPFARPHFADILRAIDFVNKNDYPARGEA